MYQWQQCASQYGQAHHGHQPYPAPMHAAKWDGPPDLGDHQGFLSRLGRSSAWSFHARDDRCGAPQPADEDNDVSGDLCEEDYRSKRLMKHKGVYYLQSPEAVNGLLNVERYAARWPLIPVAELHASSIQHPLHPEWRWLLHSRRVPVQAIASDEASSVAQPADDRPRCAGGQSS